MKLPKSCVASGDQRGLGAQALCDPLWKPRYVDRDDVRIFNFAMR